MRKITREARSALLGRRRFCKGNTSVSETGDGDWCLFLHGNAIVLLHADGTTSVSDGGWWGVTTKERLNAFTSVYQAKHEAYLMGIPWDGRWINVDKAEDARHVEGVNERLEVLRNLAADKHESSEAYNRACWIYDAWSADGEVAPPVADYFHDHFPDHN